MKHKLLDEWWKTSINCGKQSDYLGVTLNICESLLEGDDWGRAESVLPDIKVFVNGPLTMTYFLEMSSVSFTNTGNLPKKDVELLESVGGTFIRNLGANKRAVEFDKLVEHFGG